MRISHDSGSGIQVHADKKVDCKYAKVITADNGKFAEKMGSGKCGARYDSVTYDDESHKVLLMRYFILILNRLSMTLICQRHEAMNQYINYSPKSG